MKSQFSRRDIIVQRIAIWSWFALYLIAFILSWLLQGKRWLDVSTYVGAVNLGLQLAALAFVTRRRGIAETILVAIGGMSFLGFVIWLRMWLLLLGAAAYGADLFCLAWPQIRHLFHRMSQSYRDIAAANKM